MENLSDRELRILRLVHLINQMNDAIAVEKKLADPDLNSLDNWTRLKMRFEKELLEILTTEMGIRIPVAA